MSEQKLLTLCIPTYNRGEYLEQQLKRLSSIYIELWKDITVFISDNCSTDNTEEVVKKYINLPVVDIQYSKNIENLGMDGNFVKCFRAAKTKYVWLLGDDDYIIPDKLPQVIELLKKEDYGLCHLGIYRNDDEDSVSYNDNEKFIREIGIWITYISSNIVNTKYVSEINFDKYIGTYFTLIPFYLTSILRFNQNLMINYRIFENGKDVQRNGGYNYVKVFIDNYLTIFNEYVNHKLLSPELYDYEKNMVLNFVMPYMFNVVVRGHKSNYITSDSWKILFKYYGILNVSVCFTRYVFARLKFRISNIFNCGK